MSREGHKGLTSVYRRWIGLPTLFEINWRLNVRRIMKRVRRAIFLPALLLLVLPAESNSAAEANALKLLISLEQQSVTAPFPARITLQDRKSTRLNSSHSQISYAVFCLKKKKKHQKT